MINTIVPDMDTVFFADSSQGIESLKNAGVNYFLVSKELKLYSPIVVSPIFSPETISKHLGIKWTDGTVYLLTWRENTNILIDDSFLSAYRQLIEESPTVQSFPTESWRHVFEHLRTNGIKPYSLPWCTTCEGLSEHK